jgi:hypothetical protein
MNKSNSVFFLFFILLITNLNAKSFPVSLPLNASPNPFSGISNGDTILITSVLTINTSVTYPQNNLVIIIQNNGAINWPNNSNFTIGDGGEVIINGNGGLTNSSACNANKILTIGNTNVARCNGAASTNSFNSVNTAGGVTQAGLFSLLSLQNEKAVINRIGFTNFIQWASYSSSPIKSLKLNHSFNQFDWKTINNLDINNEHVNYSFNHFQPEISNDFYQIEVEFFDGNTQLSSVFNYNQSKKIKIQVYPNPFNETIFISDLESEYSDISILDINGKEIMSSNTEGINSVQLNLSELQKGIYFLKINNENQNFIEKIIKL